MYKNISNLLLRSTASNTVVVVVYPGRCVVPLATAYVPEKQHDVGIYKQHIDLLSSNRQYMYVWRRATGYRCETNISMFSNAT